MNLLSEPDGKVFDLVIELSELKKECETIPGDKAFTGQDYLRIADTFRSAAKQMDALKKQNSPLSAKYEQLSKLFTALKRFHLSHGAPTLMEEGAAREIARIPLPVREGLKNHQPETKFITEKKYSLNLGFDAGPVKVELEPEFQSKKTFMINEEGDALFSRQRTIDVKQKGGKDFHVGTVVGVDAGGKISESGTHERMIVSNLNDLEKIAMNDRANAKVANMLNPTHYSASEYARKIYQRARKSENWAGKWFGLPGHDPDSPLFLTNKKVPKGVANQSQILEIAEKLGNKRLINLIKHVYQSVPDYLQSHSNGESADLPRNILRKVNPLPGAVVKRWGMEFKGELEGACKVKGPSYPAHPIPVVGAAGLELGLGLSVAAAGREDLFILKLPGTTSLFLDPNKTKSIPESRKLLDEIIENRRENDSTIAELNTYPAKTFPEIKEKLESLRSKYIEFIKYEDSDNNDEINRLVWNNSYHIGNFKKNSKEFISHSYDEFNLALAKLGVELAELKRDTSRLHDSERVGLANASIDADQAYTAAKDIIEEKFLKTNDHDLLKHTSSKAVAKWYRGLMTFEGKGKLPVGSAGDYNPIQLNGEFHATGFSVKHHPDPLRRGIYMEYKFKYNIITLPNIIKFLTDKNLKLPCHFGILATEGATGKMVTLSYRKAIEDDSGVPPKFKLQCCKLTNTSKMGIAGKTSSLPAGPFVGFGISNTQTMEPVHSQELGDDIGYHLLQYSHLKRDFIDRVAESQHKAIPDYTAVQEPDPPDYAAALRKEGGENREIMDTYFGTPTILDIVEDFQQFTTNPIQPASEFERFEKEPFTGIAHELQSAEHFAPGSKKSIAATVSEDLLGNLKDWFTRQRFDLPVIRRQESSERTAKQRMEALCARGENSASVFDAYLRIMGTYKKLSDAVSLGRYNAVRQKAIPWATTGRSNSQSRHQIALPVRQGSQGSVSGSTVPSVPPAPDMDQPGASGSQVGSDLPPSNWTSYG
ncbi:hypothetical protein DUT91_24080 [Phyllobacterium salinisoli]|uniref:Uncharacterized protein n=2 Tax=Phyllobacterium salinisoli TaxID=1899321 RepID=A0A368JWB2_9HYPH|nr:hypothetical protein DUT91_24080 [Phyllobacterium salinisoli]